MQQRGLVVSDLKTAEFYLGHLNYYRLSAYWIPYLENRQTNYFKQGTKFEDILNLYTFDRELRLLILDAIERIEISIRSKWAYHLSQRHGTHAHLNPNLFKNKSNKPNKREWKHTEAVLELQRTVSQSKEDFIIHFRNKYQEPLPPLWALVEIMTFGQLSHWFCELKNREDRNIIAHLYDMDESNLVSFLHHLNFIRNKCAHHDRLWNRNLTITPKLPKKRPACVANSVNRHSERKIYNTLVILAYFLDIISPDNHWKVRLFSLIKSHQIDINQMGFPQNYKNLSIWRSAFLTEETEGASP